MFKLILTAAALAGLLAAPTLYAQEDKPGEARAYPSKPATKEEKAAAKQQRRSTSKEMAKKDEGRVDDDPHSTGTAKVVSKDQKAAAKAKRKDVGKQAAKEGSGRLEDEGGPQKK